MQELTASADDRIWNEYGNEEATTEKDSRNDFYGKGKIEHIRISSKRNKTHKLQIFIRCCIYGLSWHRWLSLSLSLADRIVARLSVYNDIRTDKFLCSCF